MSAAVKITRTCFKPDELREFAKREQDSKAARRLLALALVLEGVERRQPVRYGSSNAPRLGSSLQ